MKSRSSLAQQNQTSTAPDWAVQYHDEEDFRSGLEALEAAARRGRALSRTAALPETLAVLLVWKSSATFSTAHNYAKACLNNGAPWRLRAGATAPVVTVPNVTVPTVTAPAMAPLLQKGFALVQGRGRASKALEFLQEVSILEQVQCPQVVQLLDVTIGGGYGNVLVFCQEKWRAKLADFGNAQVYMTLPALTLNYRSPEVILGKRPGPPSDMWSLGVLLYEMMWLLGGNDVLRQLLQPDFALRPTEMSEPDANAAVELGSKTLRKMCAWLLKSRKWNASRLRLIPSVWRLTKPAQKQTSTEVCGRKGWMLGCRVLHMRLPREGSVALCVCLRFAAKALPILIARKSLSLVPADTVCKGKLWQWDLDRQDEAQHQMRTEFNLTISDFAEEEDGSKPWWRQRRLAVTRSIVATNDCELPVEVAQIDIGGIPGCSAFGFEAREIWLTAFAGIL
ncbi:Transmembrane protein 131 [Durusdinium trenchii]|uniref:Cyclin-dependent kinase 2 homolog n=1 Tax=Durusdinium trenchii TaxID=1381693 RepID=A0ABP0PF61_9DINO